MCGLAGIVDPRGTDARTLVAMGDALAHRGPDGDGLPRARGRVSAGTARWRCSLANPHASRPGSRIAD